MLIRKLTTFGLFGTLMLLGLSCGEPPTSGEEVNVRVIVQAVGSAPQVISMQFYVSAAGEDVDFTATSSINGSGQAEITLSVTSGGVPKLPNPPLIVVDSANSGCIGCPAGTTGGGSFTQPGMTPGYYDIPIKIRWTGQTTNASAAIDFTLDQEPGMEWSWIRPAQQTVGNNIVVAVKPTNPEGDVTDLALTAEFLGFPTSQVDLLDGDSDGIYVNTDALAAPAPAGSHTLVITIRNTVTSAITEILHPYVSTAP